MAVVLAPAIGPTLGGFITDHFSWRWIFYVNVPFGILSLFLTHRMISDPPWLQKARSEAQRQGADFLGLVLIATSLGAFQIVLDKGQRDDWFASPLIVAFTVISSLSLFVFLFWDWHHPHPVVKLRLFKNRNFAACNALMFLLGTVLLGTTVLIPQFLQTLLGYTAQKAGEVLTPGGFALLMLLPFVGATVSKIDARWYIGLGFVLSALTLVQLSHLTLDIDFHTAMWWRIDQTASLAFLFVPINTISYIDIPQEDNNQVSAMINLMRNVGSSVGISVFSTMLARREQVHLSYLSGNLSQSNPVYRQHIDDLSRHLTHTGGAAASAKMQAVSQTYRLVEAQASVLSYVDIIWIFVLASLVGIFVVLFAKRNRPGQVAAGH
jgi:DHA2 family multidrug resistance protein